VKAAKAATSAKDAAVASLKAITLRVVQAEKRLRSLTKVTSGESRLARERLTAIAAQRRDAVMARREYDEQRGLYRQAKEAHARDVDNRTRKQKMRDWADRLEKLQQYMHRSGLPKSVHNEALSLLEERINPTLASLGAAFRVTVDEEDASLVAVMPNGRNTPAQALSGGQQVSVAWSYRLTVKETFASHFDTLVLDEPTQWLDDQRMDCLVEVLNHVRRRARKLGQQIIIVSHSERLRRVFDKILKVPDAGAS
jgi:DNA repair exonuclease SbcCD ATPase subunit